MHDLIIFIPPPPALKKRGVYSFTSVCPSVSPSVPWIFFVAFFSETTIQGFLKFSFRVYLSQLYGVMRFQIDHLTTSCLLNTCIFLHYLFFRRIFLRNYNTRISEIWFQDLYKSVIPFDAFSDSSLDNFLFTEHLHIFTLLILSTCGGGIISEQ